MSEPYILGLVVLGVGVVSVLVGVLVGRKVRDWRFERRYRHFLGESVAADLARINAIQPRRRRRRRDRGRGRRVSPPDDDGPPFFLMGGWS